MTKRAVLVVSTSYPTAGDGSEAAGAFVVDFVDALSAYVPVRVVAPGRTEGKESGARFPTWRFTAGDTPLSLLSPIKPWHWPSILRAVVSLRRQVFRAAADGDVAHVHALWVLPSGWAARELAKATNATYSVWALGSDIWSLGRLPLVRSVLAAVSRGADFAYADGIQLARDAQGVSGRKFEFMPSCRTLAGLRERATATMPPYRLLYLGRWHRNKGTDLLFDALEELKEQDWERIAEVHVAGGGPLQRLVRMRAEKLIASGRPIRLSGFLDKGRAELALGNADRLLLPSRVESIPVVFSDALAYGLPVVSMPVGDLPALLADGAGWVASEIDGRAFADAIRESLEPAGHVGEALSALKARFNPSAVAAEFASRLRSHG